MSISFSEQSYRKLAAALLVLGAVLANIAFIGLGSVFNYPDILQEPAKEILRQFMANQTAIIFWFSILAIGAGLLAPIAVILGRLGAAAWRCGLVYWRQPCRSLVYHDGY